MWGKAILPIIDFIAAACAWLLFFSYRKRVVEPSISLDEVISDDRFLIGAAIITTCWVFLFWLLGLYIDLGRRRLGEIFYSLGLAVLVGAVVLLLAVLYDDDTIGYITYLRSFVVLLVIHLLLFGVFRGLFLLIMGRRQAAIISLQDTDQSRSNYYDILLSKTDKQSIHQGLSALTQAPGETQLLLLEDQVLDADSIIPARRSIHDGYFAIYTDTMPYWQRNVKLFIDKSLSLLALIALSPVLIYAAIRTKLSSDGGIFYEQERVGERHHPFRIIKFRSMYADAESDGPQLSSVDDERVTSWGRTMRRYRIDELPQFINVLRGDMSLVGPRPEREYYWQQILESDPSLSRLLTVRPGITSMGQVRYGYASDLDQILRRSKYDRLYMDNRSLWMDVRILFTTIGVVLKGKGH